MKLILNSFVYCVFFISTSVLADIYEKNFIIEVSGIKIGKLNWIIKIDDKNYLSNLNLKSEGFLSSLYKFSGEYYSEGVVSNKKLKPHKYTHVWKTKKIKKNMELVFQGNKLTKIIQTPYEKEMLRIDVFNKENNKDPITSFLQIMLGEKNSMVIDGRRIYKMNVFFNDLKEETIIEISDYFNLWADHKKRKFEKLVFKKNKVDFFPKIIKIFFDGRVFSIKQY